MGNREGGLKAAATNKAKYGADFYQRLGKAGGEAGYGHKFAHGKITPSQAGKLGGRPSKEVLFVKDDKPFSEGFHENASPQEKSWLNKFRRNK